MEPRRIKVCPKCGKRETRRTHGWCKECHAENMRKRRAMEKTEVEQLREENAALRVEVEKRTRERDDARALLHMAAGPCHVRRYGDQDCRATVPDDPALWCLACRARAVLGEGEGGEDD